ncbi:SDR family oxidoreductase [Sulfuriferula nivalis]|uniref:NAD(P)-dependent oxidoreductase n=1 Tax=Sulfuriferula nivalis TaxID=2675298 RepID=A0A809SIP4_9PROT|nr:SDR family oxidoreductase [Sulfuriferula nivalis]BBP02240.1 NAD(P)-dependent oxidoreductase [Sulfuriferula nivalis]
MRHKGLSSKRVLIVGCGDVGTRTAKLLLPHYRVFGMVRSTDAAISLRAAGVVPVLADLDDRSSLTRIAGLADTVLHFAPPPNMGKADTRTRNLLAALAQHGVRRLIYISTSGVYGDCAGEYIDETRTPNPVSARGVRRAEAEQQMRQFARQTGVQIVIVRVPGIYAAERLPIDRLQRGTPVLRAADDVYTNHIHADDLAGIAVAALYRGANCRVYHASDDSELKMAAYFALVAEAYNLPMPEAISREQAQACLSPMQMSFMSESRRMLNQRMKRELRVRLRYATVGDFLAGV